jgi:predicted Zn-dependent protease
MARRAHQLDPLSMTVNVEYGTRLLDTGKRDEALTHLQRTVELDPNYYDTYVHLSHVFEALGRPDDQVAAALRGAEVSGRAAHALQALARAYAVTGNQLEALKILDELHKRPTQRNAYDVAMIHLRLKEFERVLVVAQGRRRTRGGVGVLFPQLPRKPVRSDSNGQTLEQVLRCAGVTK